MNSSNFKAVGFSLLSAAILGLASCETEQKPSAPAGSSDAVTAISVESGTAGGVIDETFTVSATVSAVDKSTRRITLSGEGGKTTTFTAPAEVRNFDQISVGDKVEASIRERLAVFVRSNDPNASMSHSAAVATAPKGAKPGVMAAETFEIVGVVKSIDTTTRKATLEFSEGQTRTVSVRKDVDLSRYKPGDSVVIRVTQALSVVVEKP